MKKFLPLFLLSLTLVCCTNDDDAVEATMLPVYENLSRVISPLGNDSEVLAPVDGKQCWIVNSVDDLNSINGRYVVARPDYKAVDFARRSLIIVSVLVENYTDSSPLDYTFYYDPQYENTNILVSYFSKKPEVTDDEENEDVNKLWVVQFAFTTEKIPSSTDIFVWSRYPLVQNKDIYKN